jgi:hypothetical protein
MNIRRIFSPPLVVALIEADQLFFAKIPNHPEKKKTNGILLKILRN